MTEQIVQPADFLTEDKILDRWPMLSKRELRAARKANPPAIGFYDFTKRRDNPLSGPCSTPAQVQDYIDRTYLKAAPCQKTAAAPSASRSATTISTSPIQNTAASTTPAATTMPHGESAAKALAQRIRSRPKSSSPSSSQPRRQQARQVKHLRVVKS